MAKIIVFFIVCLTLSLFADGAKEKDCDYSFGDSTWEHSRVFYDKQIRFPGGAKNHSVILPAQKGLMISYVCIKLPSGMYKKDIKADFHPLDRQVSVQLAQPAPKTFKYHVFAKRHGY